MVVSVVTRRLGKNLSVATSAMLGLALCGSGASAAVLLNDTWADGNRNSTNLPTDSPTWIGQSAGNGSNSVSAGSLNFLLPTNSAKIWEYFTSDASAPDANQPHNSVAQLTAGQTLTASVQFKLPQGAVANSTARDFRFGLFLDPTDARVQADTNSDSGGATNPWGDAQGYDVQFPMSSTANNATPFQIGKRTSSANTGLMSSGSSYTFPTANGGQAYALVANTLYTARLLLTEVSSTQLDVTAQLLDNTNTVISSYTVSDLGTTFGGTAINGTGVPNNNQIYTNFDQLALRISANGETVHDGVNPDLVFTNFAVDQSVTPPSPEPGSMSLLAIGGLMALRRGRRSPAV